MIWWILLLGFILRVITINQSLWLDEAINVLATTQYGFLDMVTKYSLADFHPPGYFVLLWIWTRMGGIGEIWVRLPSVIFGIMTVWLVFLLGKEFFNRKTALLAALFMALAPLHVYYSQEARMYSLATFAAVACFYFFWRLINYGSKWDRLGYIITGILVLYSDYVVYFIFPAQALYVLLNEGEKLKRFLLPLSVIILTLTPWLFIFPKQLATGTGAATGLPGWADVVGGAGIKDLLLIPVKTFFGRISIENKLLYGLVASLVGLVYGFVIYKGLKKFDKQVRLLIFWVAIPLALTFVVSFFIPVLSYFRILFILPPVYLLLAKGVDTLRTQAWPGRLALSAVCIISLISLFVYYTNPKFQREDWRKAVKEIEIRVKDDSLILFESNDVIAPFKYYETGRRYVQGGLVKVPAKDNSDVIDMPPSINEIYLFEYLVDITDPERLLEKKIEAEGFKKVKTIDFSGVGFVHHYILQY